MRNIFLGLLLFTTTSSIAAELTVAECAQKAEKAAKSIASIEAGSDVVLLKSMQESLATSTNFLTTYLYGDEGFMSAFLVTTKDGEGYKCAIDSVKYVESFSDLYMSRKWTDSPSQ